MIAELGHAALWLAAGMALLQMAGLLSRRPGWSGIAVPAALAQAWFLIAALLALLWCFAMTDLSVALVNDSSHSLKAAGERLADIARHGGGQLLILAVITGFAGGVTAFKGRRGLMIHGLASIAVIGATLVADPFARIDSVAAQGRSLADGAPLPFLGLAMLALVMSLIRSRWAWGSLGAAVAVILIIVGADQVRRIETVADLRVGEQVSLGPLHVRLTGLAPVAGPGHTAVRARLLVSAAGQVVTSLQPESRSLIYPAGHASPAAVAVIGAGAVSARVSSTGPNSAALQLVWHPFLP